MKTAYTDYPFDFLGDVAGQKAPIREIQVDCYDGNKYVKIFVEGHETEIKSGYIYIRPGRCGQTKRLFPRTHIGLYHD